VSTIARPAFLCPVCQKNGPTVEPGPEQHSETWRLFDEHLATHTKWELEAYVWRLMRNPAPPPAHLN
jgi:hypothetical protein